MWLKPWRQEISGGKEIREGTQFKSLEEEEGRVPNVNDCSASGLTGAPVILCVQILFHWTYSTHSCWHFWLLPTPYTARVAQTGAKKKMYLSVCFLSSKDMPSFHVEISYFKSLYIKASTVFALLLKSYSIDLNQLFKNVAITLKSQSEMLESFFPPPFFLLKHCGSCLL